MKKTGIGIIGTGAIALKHAQALQELEHARLVALYNPTETSAANARERFDAPVLTDLDEFLRLPDLNMVCICTPSGMHMEPGLAAVRAGKHLMVEKPIEISLF